MIIEPSFHSHAIGSLSQTGPLLCVNCGPPALLRQRREHPLSIPWPARSRSQVCRQSCGRRQCQRMPSVNEQRNGGQGATVKPSLCHTQRPRPNQALSARTARNTRSENRVEAQSRTRSTVLTSLTPHSLSPAMHLPLRPMLACFAHSVHSSPHSHPVHNGYPTFLVTCTASLAHSNTGAVARSMVHNLTHSLTRSLAHVLIHSLARLLAHSLTHSLTHRILQLSCRGDECQRGQSRVGQAVRADLHWALGDACEQLRRNSGRNRGGEVRREEERRGEERRGEERQRRGEAKRGEERSGGSGRGAEEVEAIGSHTRMAAQLERPP